MVVKMIKTPIIITEGLTDYSILYFVVKDNEVHALFQSVDKRQFNKKPTPEEIIAFMQKYGEDIEIPVKKGVFEDMFKGDKIIAIIP